MLHCLKATKVLQQSASCTFADAGDFAQFNQQLSQNSGQGRSLKDYGIDPQAWIKDPTEAGSDNVNGVDTTHVTGSVDIGRMFSDFNKTIQKAGTMGTTATPQQLSPNTIKKVQDVVKNPKFDIYVGKGDNKIRRLSVSVDFQIPLPGPPLRTCHGTR